MTIGACWLPRLARCRYDVLQQCWQIEPDARPPCRRVLAQLEDVSYGESRL